MILKSSCCGELFHGLLGGVYIDLLFGTTCQFIYFYSDFIRYFLWIKLAGW